MGTHVLHVLVGDIIVYRKSAATSLSGGAELKANYVGAETQLRVDDN